MIQLPKKSAFILFGLASLCIMLPGCVRRRMTVRTNPAGAMVYVDRQPIGKTPASHSFTYYGTRHFEIVKDGYRTEEFLRTFNPPWYQIPPLDFFSETLWPFEQRDERIIDVQMVPETNVPTDALLASADGLRLQASQGVAVVPSTNTPIPDPKNPFRLGIPGNRHSINGMSTQHCREFESGHSSDPPRHFQSNSPNTNGGQIPTLPELLQPPMSIPSLQITPGNSYRPPTGPTVHNFYSKPFH